MRPSFYVQRAVDKEVENKCSFVHGVGSRLFFGFAQANDDFAASVAEGIGKDIWHVRLTAHLLV